MPERGDPRARDRHRIEVVLRDGHHQHLHPGALDVMLNNDWVVKFKRSSGWVTVGVDPVRVKPRSDVCPLYYGHERRRPATVRS